MDAPTHSSWRELCTFACDKEFWRERVRAMKQPRVTIEISIKDTKTTNHQPYQFPKIPNTTLHNSTTTTTTTNKAKQPRLTRNRPKRKKKHKHKHKHKHKPLTDKQRSAAATAHWYKHHPNSPLNIPPKQTDSPAPIECNSPLTPIPIECTIECPIECNATPSPTPSIEWSPVALLGHHQQNQQQLDSTIPITPPSIHEMFQYLEHKQQHQKNLANISLAINF